MNQRIKQGYYRLESGEVVRAPYYPGRYSDTVFIWDKWLNQREIPKDTMAKATPLPNYRPTPAELWAMSEGAQRTNRGPGPTEERRKEIFMRMGRMQNFIERLIEFNHIRVNLRGYFGGSPTRKNFVGIAVKDDMARDFAMKFAEHIFDGFPPGFEEWARNPCPETLKVWRPGGVLFALERECHVTGYRIQWQYDGKVLQPVARWDGEKHDYVALEPFKGVGGHLPRQTYTIEIASGKLALFQWINDDRLVKDLDWGERESSNSEAGRIAYSRYFESKGFWHLYVGGRSRSLYRKGNRFRIGQLSEDLRRKPKAWRGWKLVGEMSFETDLRWFTACDASRLKPEHYKEDEVLVVEVPPGKYALTDYVEGGKDETLMAEFEQVND